MSLRRTRGIVTDGPSSDAKIEADVVMTAATLGFAADYIATNRQPLQFDIEALETGSGEAETAAYERKWVLFNSVVAKMDTAIADFLTRKGLMPAKVRAGLTPGYWPGAMIMGVYALANQERPAAIQTDVDGSPLAAPVLSEKGQALWDRIATPQSSIPQYTGRGAYTGFVDNKNTEGDTDPVGPRSTVRMVAPATGADGAASERWLPPDGHPLWNQRKRRDDGTYVPWGLIGGNRATEPAKRPGTKATNAADEIEREMRDVYGMVFVDEPTITDVATYTHGMIQAIYKAYALGPSCVPYEIAVGDQTKKMASCLGCTFFMYAVGYPPTSIHLGSAESWAPLYAPYNPDGPTEPNEQGVIRDLNNAWSARCREWLSIGIEILDDRHIAPSHRSSRDAVGQFIDSRAGDPSTAAHLILDALTVHDPELNRIARTL